MLFYSEIHITAQRCLVSGFFLLSQIFIYTADARQAAALLQKKLCKICRRKRDEQYASYAGQVESLLFLIRVFRQRDADSESIRSELCCPICIRLQAAASLGSQTCCTHERRCLRSKETSNQTSNLK